MLIPSFRSHLIRRLGESSGISQPGYSHLSAPDIVGKTSLIIDIPLVAQASTARCASLIRQRVPVHYWQLLLTMCLTSPMAPRHATPDLSIPVEACRPLSLHILVLINITLFIRDIQQSSGIRAVHPAYPNDLFSSRMTGYYLNLGF